MQTSSLDPHLSSELAMWGIRFHLDCHSVTRRWRNKTRNQSVNYAIYHFWSETLAQTDISKDYRTESKSKALATNRSV